MNGKNFEIIKSISNSSFENIVCPNSSIPSRKFELINISKILSVDKKFYWNKLIVYWENHLPKIIFASTKETKENILNIVRTACYHFSLVPVTNLFVPRAINFVLIKQQYFYCKYNSVTLDECSFKKEYGKLYSVKYIVFDCIPETIPLFSIQKIHGEK